MRIFFRVLANSLIESLNISIILIIGWFLISFFLKGQFLETGYNDWLYHAYRIDLIREHGIPSWDHIWGNGANINRAYHFSSHFLALWFQNLTGLSTTQTMIWVTILCFFAIRVMIYTFLRLAGLAPKWALAAAILSYTYPNQWPTMKDYAAYVNGIVLVPYAGIWIYSYKKPRIIYLLAALSGLLFLHHLVIALFSLVLLTFRIFTSKTRNSILNLFTILLFTLPGFIAYAAPYIYAQVRFNNPFHQSITFFTNTVIGDYFGLGFIFMSCFVIFSLLILFIGHKLTTWPKALFTALLVYTLATWLGTQDALPEILIKTQFARGMTYVGMLFPLVIGGFLLYLTPRRANIFVTTIIVIITSHSIIQSIETSTRWSAQPINELSHTEILNEIISRKPTGSISVNYSDIGKYSYLAGNELRFINSYNEQLLPSPFAVRFNQLLKNDINFTGISEQQMRLINDYATVLGIEYIVVPQGSPFEVSTKLGLYAQNMFEIVGTYGTQTLLHNSQPIHYAYLADVALPASFINFQPLPKPNHNITSYTLWDQEISEFAQAIRNQQLVPVNMQFIGIDSLRFQVDPTLTQNMQKPVLISTINFDPSWQIPENDSYQIQSTNLRFIYLQFNQSIPKEFALINNWPSWHWPLHYLAFLTVPLSLFAVYLPTLIQLLKSSKNKESVTSSPVIASKSFATHL